MRWMRSTLFPVLLVLVLGSSIETEAAIRSYSLTFDKPPSTGEWQFADDIGESSFQLGYYTIAVSSGTAWSRMHLGELDGFVATTDFVFAAGTPPSAAGIVFDYKSAKDFSVFFVTGDGYSGLWHFNGDVFENREGWRQVQGVLPAGQNIHLAVGVGNGLLSCTLNGTQVYLAPHPAGTSGDIGLAAMAWRTGRVSFSRIDVADTAAMYSYRVSVASMRILQSINQGSDWEHYLSVDGDPEVRFLGPGPIGPERTTLYSAASIAIRTVETERSSHSDEGTGRVTVSLPVDPQINVQTVSVTVCEDEGSGPNCSHGYAVWEYVLQIAVEWK